MNLSAKDILMIMQRAAKLGVSELTLGEIDIKFSQNRSVSREASISQIPATPQAIAEVPIVAAPPEVEQTSEEKALEEWRGKEVELLNGPVLNPYDWEQSQIGILENGEYQGEIEDAESVQV